MLRPPLHRRSFIPKALIPAARAVYHRAFRLQLRLRCWSADLTSARAPDDSPLPPALLRYRVSETLDRGEFLTIGQGCARLLEEHCSLMGVNLAVARRVLDFGCGCGRTLRWMLPAFSGVEFHGADVDPDAIRWCRENLPAAQFLESQPAPPLIYVDGHFDIIYCLSVFTHLDETSQDLWLHELSRLLAPGGLLLITVHGARAAAALDPEGVQMLRTSGFVHRRTRKLKGIVPDWYQTTWHSERYITSRLAAIFETVQYCDVPGGMQAFVMARGPRYFPRNDFTSTVSPL